MQKTKLFKKYETMLNDQKYLSESDISAIKSRISGMSYSLTESEIEELKVWVEHDNIEFMIYPEHAQKGIDYLKEKCLKLNGRPRKTKQVSNMDHRFFYAIQNYDHFTFVGFEEVEFNVYSTNSFYMPVWRIHTTDGQTFDYCMDIGLSFKEVGYNPIETKLKLVG